MEEEKEGGEGSEGRREGECGSGWVSGKAGWGGLVGTRSGSRFVSLEKYFSCVVGQARDQTRTSAPHLQHAQA